MNNRLINKLMVALPIAAFTSAFSSASDVKASDGAGDDDDMDMVNMESFERYYSENSIGVQLERIRSVKEAEKSLQELRQKLDELEDLTNNNNCTALNNDTYSMITKIELDPE